MNDTLTISRTDRDPGPVGRTVRRVWGWLDREARAKRGHRLWSFGRRNIAIHAFACRVRDATPQADWPNVLVAQAGQLARARQVELLLDDAPGRNLRVVARWPENPGAAVAGAPSLPLGNIRDVPDRMLAVPLRFAGRTRGVLRLDVGSRRRSRRTLQCLETLATLAAAAAVASDDDPSDAATRDPATGVHNEPFLDAYLTHALALAQRRGEPLTLLCLGIEGLEVARQRNGSPLADAALRQLARAVVGTLRASDVVARVDSGDASHLVAVLPAAPAVAAPRVALALRRSIAEAGATSGLAPPLTVAIGAATYPDGAETPAGLRAAAFNAWARARAAGEGAAESPG